MTTRQDGAIVVGHEFTLVHALNPQVDSQGEVLCLLAGSDCADATVGLDISHWPSAGGVAGCDDGTALAVAQMARVLPGAVLVEADIG